MAESRTAYTVQLNQVLDYIYTHLEEPLSLDVLARVAGFSPFHFHRLFKALVGETLNDYVQRIRLERAANLLYDPARPALGIAIECGFSSAAVFARAFRAHFGLSPSLFRAQQRKIRKVERKQGKASSPTAPYHRDHLIQPGPFETGDSMVRSLNMISVEVKTLPAFHVAFVRHIYGYAKGQFNPEINAAFQRVCGWAAARGLFRTGTLVIGIPYDNPEITPNDRCRYDACVTVPQDAAPAGEVRIQEIPGGKFAVIHLEISSAETHKIGEAVDQLYGEWLPDSGCQADDKPPLEIYNDNPGKPAGTWISMDYCLPVKPM